MSSSTTDQVVGLARAWLLFGRQWSNDWQSMSDNGRCKTVVDVLHFLQEGYVSIIAMPERYPPHHQHYSHWAHLWTAGRAPSSEIVQAIAMPHAMQFNMLSPVQTPHPPPQHQQQHRLGQQSTVVLATRVAAETARSKARPIARNSQNIL